MVDECTQTWRTRYASESDDGPYPFGPDITIEGGSDRHALMLDRDAHLVRALQRTGGRRPDRRRRDLRPRLERPRPAGWTSADAAGLPIFPASFDGTRCRPARSITRSGSRSPAPRDASGLARHQAGLSDRRCPPMGARFRLMVVRHLRVQPERAGRAARHERLRLDRRRQRERLVLAGHGRRRWTNGLLDQLKEARRRCSWRSTPGDAACRRTAPSSRTDRTARRRIDLVRSAERCGRIATRQRDQLVDAPASSDTSTGGARTLLRPTPQPVARTRRTVRVRPRRGSHARRRSPERHPTRGSTRRTTSA